MKFEFLLTWNPFYAKGKNVELNQHIWSVTYQVPLIDLGPLIDILLS